jgi:hypothetical protein
MYEPSTIWFLPLHFTVPFSCNIFGAR